ncbi:MAG: putative zinc-binding peptidase [Verrucomicrobia bacterium]|nr:putative zinc-binding peptidase [Verrucomicrobiota bacterium]
MNLLLDSLSRRLASAWRGRDPQAGPGHNYQCRCDRPVFFQNSHCLGCQSPLGYLPEAGTLTSLTPVKDSSEFTVTDAADGQRVRRCANLDSPAGCNWLVPSTDPNPLCRACRLNHTIPDLSLAENGELWRRIERPKRRLVAQLLRLGLPVTTRVEEDPEQGLMFDFLRSTPDGPRILTGHAGGLITLNIEEADDAVREKMRSDLHEPYRTLLGHLRHEVGHYYWDRLILNTPWHAPFRALFGDEQADYSAALKRHYEAGPPGDWPQRHVSAYAAAHPWEDWAETWAHYLHTVDALGTALAFGVDASDLEFQAEPFRKEDLHDPADPDAARFLELINSWVELTAVMNELARSMGQPDLYPFVLSKPAVRKLHFIHQVVSQAAGRAAATRLGIVPAP